MAQVYKLIMNSYTLIAVFLVLGISLFQYPTVLNMGISQEKLTLVPMEMTEKYQLPDDFAIVPAIALKRKTFPYLNHLMQL